MSVAKDFNFKRANFEKFNWTEELEDSNVEKA